MEQRTLKMLVLPRENIGSSQICNNYKIQCSISLSYHTIEFS